MATGETSQILRGAVVVASCAATSLQLLGGDGSIVAWGDNYYGQCTVPLPNSDYKVISTRHVHCLSLRANGSAEGWGYNWYGQCDPPDPNEGFLDVTAGAYHSVVLLADGSVYSWGGE